MAEVYSNNELLKQAPSFTLCESTIMCQVVPLNEVHQITTRSILADNAKVIRREEDFLELDDVGVCAAQPLIQDLSLSGLDAASQHSCLSHTLAAGGLGDDGLESPIGRCKCADMHSGCKLTCLSPCQ